MGRTITSVPSPTLVSTAREEKVWSVDFNRSLNFQGANTVIPAEEGYTPYVSSVHMYTIGQLFYTKLLWYANTTTVGNLVMTPNTVVTFNPPLPFLANSNVALYFAGGHSGYTFNAVIHGFKVKV